jgi:hypothetical protein
MTTGKQVFFDTKLEWKNHHFHLFETKINSKKHCIPFNSWPPAPPKPKNPTGFYQRKGKKIGGFVGDYFTFLHKNILWLYVST